jgi:hypothetical protein
MMKLKMTLFLLMIALTLFSCSTIRIVDAYPVIGPSLTEDSMGVPQVGLFIGVTFIVDYETLAKNGPVQQVDSE